MPPSNSAAWLSAKCTNPLVIKPAPYTPAGPGEIVIRNGAVAINPVDWMKQRMGDIMLSHIRYPFILGCDVAGEVVEVGPGVGRFHVGDRVLGNAVGGVPDVNSAAEGAFQLYAVVREHLASPIPDSISYEQACVIPLGLATAAYGLFHADFLGLECSSVSIRPKPARKAVIVTGGASSVGSNAVQLAASAGYAVYSTCSPKNFDYVRRLGAEGVFDYHGARWADELTEALCGKAVAGAYAIGDGAALACLGVLKRLSKDGGDVKKMVVYAGFPTPSEQRLKTTLGSAALVGSMLWWLGQMALRSQVAGVKAKFIDQTDLCRPDNIVGQIYKEFLPQALASKQFVPAPDPLVVGRGLEKIQEALDAHAKGVSAQKVVVSL